MTIKNLVKILKDLGFLKYKRSTLNINTYNYYKTIIEVKGLGRIKELSDKEINNIGRNIPSYSTLIIKRSIFNIEIWNKLILPIN